MCHLKNKSEINMMVAETLFEKCLYPSCCHPAYYSCLQLMKYTIQEKMGIPYHQQDIEINRIDKRVARSGSHNYLIDKIVYRMKELDKDEARLFKRSIEDLKASREDSDYKDIPISRDYSEKSINTAKIINSQLIKIFKI